jgi:ribonuclease Z
MKRLIWIVPALLIIGLFLGRGSLMDAITERQIDRTLNRVQNELLTDGELHVVLCGTAAAVPQPDRGGPCTAILANGEFLLIDIGPASWRNVDRFNLPIEKLTGILLTHFHSDHIGDLGEAVTQSWIAGRTATLPVYGPPGTLEVVEGFRQAYAQDVGYRIAHHGADYLPPDGARASAKTFVTPAKDAEVQVLERNGLRVTAFRVHHDPVQPAVGYRIEYRGRIVVVSGDTTPTEATVRAAKGADLLIHEALAAHLTERAKARASETGYGRLSKMIGDVVDYHSTPVQAAEIAQRAGAKTLVLTHVFPPLANGIARRMFMRGVSKAFDGEIVLGHDGQRFDLTPLADQQAE